MEKEVQIVDYDPIWAKQYKEEAAKLKKLLGENFVGCYHIGGTVLKGSKTQPIIDIMLVVKKLDENLLVRDEMNAGVRIHMFEEKNVEDITRFYAVSSYLACHEEERKKYDSVKQQLAEQYKYDCESYEKEKKVYIGSLEERAISWQMNQNKLGTYMAMGMSLGLAGGCAVGYIFGGMLWGMIAGTLAGLALGILIGHKKVESSCTTAE